MDISILRVAVVLHHRELPPRPDPPSQQCLVGSVALPASPAQGVLQDALPGLEPLLSHLLLGDESGTAQRTKCWRWDPVSNIVLTPALLGTGSFNSPRQKSGLVQKGGGPDFR